MAGESPVDQVIQSFDAARVHTGGAPAISVVHVEGNADRQAEAGDGTHVPKYAASLPGNQTINLPTGDGGATIITQAGPTIQEIEGLLNKAFGDQWQASLVAQARSAVTDDLQVLRDQIQNDIRKDAPQIVQYGAVALAVLAGVGILILVYLMEQAISGHNPVAESYMAALGTRLNALPLPQILGGIGLLLFPSPLGRTRAGGNP